MMVSVVADVDAVADAVAAAEDVVKMKFAQIVVIIENFAFVVVIIIVIIKF